MATCTSGEPESPSWVWYWLMISPLASVVRGTRVLLLRPRLGLVLGRPCVRSSFNRLLDIVPCALTPSPERCKTPPGGARRSSPCAVPGAPACSTLASRFLEQF